MLNLVFIYQFCCVESRYSSTSVFVVLNLDVWLFSSSVVLKLEFLLC